VRGRAGSVAEGLGHRRKGEAKVTLAAAKEADNPASDHEARALVAHVESLFMPWNVEALVEGFTADCVVRFGSLPEFRGHQALRDFFLARSARQREYRLRKQLRARTPDTLTNTWEGTWEDADTGLRMRGFGVEVWVMRGGKIARWDAAFNAAPAERAASITDLLR
jgi:nuclear transport factor 2 (NTF2) superfamily protein